MGIVVNAVRHGACISLIEENDVTIIKNNTTCPGCFSCKDKKIQGNLNFPKDCFCFMPNTNVVFSNVNLMIDAGSSTKEHANTKKEEIKCCIKQIEKTDNFLLTHFHADHYNMLGCVRNPSINKFYYPIIPCSDVSDVAESFSKLLCLEIFLNSVIQDSFFPSLGFVFSPEFLLKIDEKKLIPAAQGTHINCKNGDKYEVIWPLPSKCMNIYTPKQENNIKNLIGKLCKENEKFSELFNPKYECVKTEQFCECIDIIRTYRNLYELISKCTNTANSASDDIRKYSQWIKLIDDTTKKVANNLSLSVYKEEYLISLGDLENDYIEKCMESNFKNSKIKVKYFITPHHGTHWHECCDNIIADTTLSSNSTGQNRYVKYCYYKNCFCTQCGYSFGGI